MDTDQTCQSDMKLNIIRLFVGSESDLKYLQLNLLNFQCQKTFLQGDSFRGNNESLSAKTDIFALSYDLQGLISYYYELLMIHEEQGFSIG